MEIEESWDHDWEDDEYDDEAYDDDDESDTIECPECGADIYEDAERCPSCGRYIIHSSRSDYLWTNRPAWWIVLGVLGILAMIVALAFGPI